MKKFLLVLLSLGLIAASATSASAIDVQISGSLYEAGIYLDKVGVSKDGGFAPVNVDGGPIGVIKPASPPGANTNFSTAFFYQRLRVRTDFIAAPGVKVVTRFDALERVWGGARSAPSVLEADGVTPLRGLSMSAGTEAENENIAFDWAYISYASPIGEFRIGYQDEGPWGTIFGDTSRVNPAIYWTVAIDNWTLMAKVVKLMDNSYSATNNTPFLATTYRSDADNDKYALGAIYSWKGGEAGLQASYARYAWLRMGGPAEILSMTSALYGINPYVKAQIGPVTIQAEVNYLFGNFVKWDSSSPLIGDIQINDLSGWLNAAATFGPVYFRRHDCLCCRR